MKKVHTPLATSFAILCTTKQYFILCPALCHGYSFHGRDSLFMAQVLFENEV